MNRSQLLRWIIAMAGGMLLLVRCASSSLPSPAPSQPLTSTLQRPTLSLSPIPSQPLMVTPERPTLPLPLSPSAPLTTTPERPTLPPSPSPVSTETTGPRILSFSVMPTTTLTVGEKVLVTWEALGEKAEICGIWGTGPVNCQDVLLQGNMTILVDEQMLGYSGLGLRVSMGQSQTWSIVNVRFLCQGWRDWFFDNPPARCPAAAAVYSRATAQNFEHGFMIWTEQPDTFYVFFLDNHQVAIFIAPYTFTTGEPVNETPPPGFIMPVSGFGKLWRHEIAGASDYRVRQRLGWATGAESAFDTAYQCEVAGHPRLWNCYLRAADGKVLHLYPDSSAQAMFLWEEW